MKKLSIVLLGMILSMPTMAKVIELRSPNARNSVSIESDGQVRFSLHRDNKPIVVDSPLSLNVDGNEWGKAKKYSSVKRYSVNGQRNVPVARRATNVVESYNAVTLNYKDYSIEFRAYDEGVAYRFVSNTLKADKVKGENVTINLAGDPMTYSKITNRMQQWFEYNYTERAYSSLPTDSLQILPVLADVDGCKVMLAEADVYNYPGIYLQKNSQSLKGEFAYFPASHRSEDKGNKRYAATREDYMTSKVGKRSFPWRIVATYDEEKDLLASELVWLLGKEEKADADFSWVRPGKVLWDWWNCWNVYGTDFKAGINTETYLYLIDYAARHGIEYLLMDEGWSAPFDLLTQAENVDMPTICRHANDKGVGILLWTKWVNLDRQMTEALDMMQEWGVKGIKVDFMDRNDAEMVNFFERTASECAKRKMMVNFHGCYPPDGMR